LTGFEEAFRALAHIKTDDAAIKKEASKNELNTSPLRVALPTGVTLLDHTRLHAQPGDRILLQGPSGSGKSTLFRTLAGIWPYAEGVVDLPADSMFLPQRAYFPNGPLRDALAYPEATHRYSDAELQQALHDALLPHLANALDTADAWSQKLSGGEQQRLAIARVLLKQPRWLFADEATSALDEAAETTLYQRLCDMVASRGGALVSIAHRPGVAAFHNQRWVLEPATEAGSSGTVAAQAAALFTLSTKPA